MKARKTVIHNAIAQRSWQVLLLGGPSGIGKTSVSYRLAHHFGIGITEVDDFQVILECMTTLAEQPVPAQPRDDLFERVLRAIK